MWDFLLHTNPNLPVTVKKTIYCKDFRCWGKMEIWPHLGLSEEQIVVMQGLFSTHQGIYCV